MANPDRGERSASESRGAEPDAFDGPLAWLRRFSHGGAPISCIEAAALKGIPLQNELKSLLLETSGSRILVHLSGDAQLSLRNVKRALNVDQAFIAGDESLKELKTSAGAICPFLPQLWNLTQVIDAALLTLKWVSTNDGTLESYVVFHPILLTTARRSVVADLSERRSSDDG